MKNGPKIKIIPSFDQGYMQKQNTLSDMSFDLFECQKRRQTEKLAENGLK